MELKHRAITEVAGEGKANENHKRNQLSELEKFMEKGKELMKKGTTWLLVGATVVFTLRCGSTATPEEDADATEEVDVQEDADALENDVRDMIQEEAEGDVLTDETEEDAEDETADVVEEDINEEDAVEDDIIEEDAEEEELPPLECPEPEEHITPAINPDFETNESDSISTTETGVNANYDLHVSMNPDIDTTECPVPDEGRYEFVCVDEDTVNIEGQYYFTATNTGTTLEPASSEMDVCSQVSDEYNMVAYEGNTPESLWNVTYDFGEETMDSIAGISLSEPIGFYFDVDGARNEIMDLTLTPSSSGTSIISFKRDAASVTFNARSFDGRESEAVNNYDADVSEVSSKILNVVAFNSTDRVSYDLEVEEGEYNLGKLCIRCDGGPYTVRQEIPLNVICAQENACGCLGKPVDVRFDVTSILISPEHFDEIVTVAGMNIDTVASQADDPKIVIDHTYTPPSDVDGMGMWIRGDVIVQGGEHDCSDGAPFSVSYEIIIRTFEPGDNMYVGPDGPDLPSTCTCDFGG